MLNRSRSILFAVLMASVFAGCKSSHPSACDGGACARDSGVPCYGFCDGDASASPDAGPMGGDAASTACDGGLCQTDAGACPSTGFSQKIDKVGNQLTIDTGDSPKLRITLAAADLVRVWADPSGSFTKDPSFAVATEDWPAVDYSLCDRGDYLQILTSELSVRVYNTPVRVDFYKADDATLISAERTPDGMGFDPTTGAVSDYRTMGADEHFYGLGQDNDALFGNLDRRGSVRDMWTGQQIAKGHVTADIPITFFMSTGRSGNGYGVFFDNTYHSQFDMGSTSTDYYSFAANGGELLYYFFNGPSFKKVLDRYTGLTGRQAMPPLWTIGYVQSKCTFYTWDEIDGVVASMRQKSIPLDAMVIDADWPNEYQDFQWNTRWNGQSPAKLAAYETQGVKFLLSTSGPMIRKVSSNYQDGLAKGVFATDGKGNTVTCGWYGGDLLDFTAPNIKSWLWPQMKHLYDEGVDGWWLDLTEPEGEPEQTVYHGGPSAKIHNAFSLLNTKAYYEMQKEYAPDTRPFILTRTGFAGIQKYGASIWTGDINSDYKTLRAHCPEALNASISGIAFWTNDSGGFLPGYFRNSTDAHGLLYERWMQFSAFAALTRAHHVGMSAPYMFGDAVEAGTKHYLQLRYRLLPYIYSHFWETHTTGAPIMRPLVFEFQDDPNVTAIKDEYLFGNGLLVAPVLREGCVSRSVYFPAGTWIDYDYGYEYQGGQSYEVQAPQSRMPLAIRAGAIIPMAPPLQYAGEKPWDPITFDIFPSGESSFTMYHDDGYTMAFETAQKFTETSIKCVEAPGASVDVTIAESNKLFTPKAYGLLVRLVSNPTSVTHDGQALVQKASQSDYDGVAEGWFWDATNLKLSVKFNASTNLASVAHISLDGAKLTRPAPPVLPADCLTDPPDSDADQMPYFFPPPILPSRIEAENYDKGGQGFAYNDTTPKNAGGEYRTDDVDIEKCSDAGGGYDVSWIDAGEWLEYTINSPQDASYKIEARVAASAGGGVFRVLFDTNDLTGPINVASTGGAQVWATLTSSEVVLKAGDHVAQVHFDTGGFSLNYLNFVLVSTCVDIPPDTTYTCAQQVGWGKCNEPWMDGYCKKSCGQCK